MKKILALAMTSVLAVMTLASCGGKYTAGEKYAAGKFEEGKYENASIGFGINVPEGYTEVPELPLVEGVTYDLALNDENDNSIYVAVENNSEKLKVDKAAENSLKALADQYESMGFKVDDQKLEDYTIGGNTYRGYTITVTKGLVDEEEEKKDKKAKDDAKDEEAKVEEAKAEEAEAEEAPVEEVPVEIVTIKQAGFFVKCDTKIATVSVTSKTDDAKKIISDNFFAIGE
ncbi:MAG: hypothetical protein E7583_08335 [Ruminococcaceae bacterium]|nr:hypothetical protein [Oscillospiraceae bacterium]